MWPPKDYHGTHSDMIALHERDGIKHYLCRCGWEIEAEANGVRASLVDYPWPEIYRHLGFETMAPQTKPYKDTFRHILTEKTRETNEQVAP